jgi:D-alanyl-D-alanine carboxypeptidase
MPPFKLTLIFLILLFVTLCNCVSDKNKNINAQPIIKSDNDSIIPSDKKQNDSLTGSVIDEIQIDPNLSPEEKERVKQILSKQYLTGQYNPATDKRFSKIPAQYLLNSAQTIYMRTEALEKYIEMQNAAKKVGIELKIISATRPFNIQKAIWERKWLGQQAVNGVIIPESVKGKDRALRIMEWNSMPGTSRHHWGTDIDLNDIDTPYWNRPKGIEIYKWLQTHAHEYGYCQVYSPVGPERPNGYKEEKWHWSYIPIARELKKAYREQIKNKDINGFLGSENVEFIEAIEKYVLGINPDCE